MHSVSLSLLVWFWGRVAHAVYVLCGRNFLSSTATDVKTCFFRQKDLRLFLILFITRSLACLDFKEWLCEVEHGGKMIVWWRCLPALLLCFPRHGVFFVDLTATCLLVPIRQSGTILKFWNAEAGWVCRGTHLRQGVWKLSCLLEACLSRPSLLGSIRKLSQYWFCALGTRVKAN